MASIVSRNFADLLSTSINLSPNIVLFLQKIGAKFDCCREAIRNISEFLFTNGLDAEGAQE